jgi:hypothetical protein
MSKADKSVCWLKIEGRTELAEVRLLAITQPIANEQIGMLSLDQFLEYIGRIHFQMPERIQYTFWWETMEWLQERLTCDIDFMLRNAYATFLIRCSDNIEMVVSKELEITYPSSDYPPDTEEIVPEDILTIKIPPPGMQKLVVTTNFQNLRNFITPVIKYPYSSFHHQEKELITKAMLELVNQYSPGCFSDLVDLVKEQDKQVEENGEKV